MSVGTTRRADNSEEPKQLAKQRLRLPFTRLLTSESSTARIKKVRRNYESMLPPCSNLRHTQRQVGSECDSHDDFERLCQAGRYKFITEGRDKHKQNEEQALREKHETLTCMKNSHNELLAKIALIAHETTLMRVSFDLAQQWLRDKSQAAKHQNTSIEELLEMERQLKYRLEQLTKKQAEAVNTNKVWNNVLKRMASDKIVHLRRRLELQEILGFVEKEETRQSQIQLDVGNQECHYRQAFRKTCRNVQSTIQFRTSNFMKLDKFMNQNRLSNQSTEQALPNRDPQHARLLMVHLFLSSMLKSKCARFRERYEEMETNFEKIKKGVVFEEDSLVEKFLSQNQSFAGMQGVITLFEDKLKQAKQRRAQLMEISHALQEEQAALEEQNSQHKKLTPDETNDISATQHAYRLLSIADWIQQQLSRIQQKKCGSSAFDWEAQANLSQPKWVTEGSLRLEAKVLNSDLASKATVRFKDLCQKLLAKLMEKEAVLCKRKPFRTTGISVKKQLIRLGSEEAQLLQYEKENFMNSNRVERNWLQQMRLQTKSPFRRRSNPHSEI